MNLWPLSATIQRSIRMHIIFNYEQKMLNSVFLFSVLRNESLKYNMLAIFSFLFSLFLPYFFLLLLLLSYREGLVTIGKNYEDVRSINLLFIRFFCIEVDVQTFFQYFENKRKSCTNLILTSLFHRQYSFNLCLL